jgi:hypothetical protein
VHAAHHAANVLALGDSTTANHFHLRGVVSGDVVVGNGGGDGGFAQGETVLRGDVFDSRSQSGGARASSQSINVRLDLLSCSFPGGGGSSGGATLPPRSPLRLSPSVGVNHLGGALTPSTHSRATVALIGGRTSLAQSDALAVAESPASSLARLNSLQHKRQQLPPQRAQSKHGLVNQPSRMEDAIKVNVNRGHKHARGMFEGSEYRVRPVPRGLY